MTQLEIILSYAICSIIAGAKQRQCCIRYGKSTVDGDTTFLAYLLGPLWLLVAIVRQVLIEKWQ